MSTAVKTFDPVAGRSGRITHVIPGSTYTAYTGLIECKLFRKVTTTKTSDWAFFNFDTSSIPADAWYLDIEFYQALSTSQPSGAPETRVTTIDLGRIIGEDGDPELNGNSTEYSALSSSDHMVTLDVPDQYANGIWINLLEEWRGTLGMTEQEINDTLALMVNLDGSTDLRIWDQSTRGTGDASWGITFNGNALHENCKLRITYDFPTGASAAGQATVTGSLRGLKFLAGAAAGAASVSGILGGLAAAHASAAGSASVSGQLRGSGTLSGACSASASCAGAVAGDGLLAGAAAGSASCTLALGGFESLIGAASGASTCSGTLAGVGELVGEASGSSVLDGVIEGTTAAASEIIASSTGSASCLLLLAGRGRIAGTAAGSARAIFVLGPLARHFGIRSVRAVNVAARSVSSVHRASRAVRIGSIATRSVSAVHFATCVCSASDSATRGPRRVA